jgi:dCMP deaminase
MAEEIIAEELEFTRTERRSKTNYYLDIAETVANRSTCLRKKYGAIIVKNDAILSTGYNGAPRGRENCCDLGFCMRDKLGIPRGERYEMCRSVHAEANAIITASRSQMIDSTLYITGIDSKTGELIPDVGSCMMCKKMIINAGIETVIFRVSHDEYNVVKVSEWVKHDDSLSGKYGY